MLSITLLDDQRPATRGTGGDGEAGPSRVKYHP